MLCALMLCLHVGLCEGTRFPGTGLTDSCKLPGGCRDLNPCPLEELPVYLTIEASLQAVKPLLMVSAFQVTRDFMEHSTLSHKLTHAWGVELQVSGGRRVGVGRPRGHG